MIIEYRLQRLIEENQNLEKNHGYQASSERIGNVRGSKDYTSDNSEGVRHYLGRCWLHSVHKYGIWDIFPDLSVDVNRHTLKHKMSLVILLKCYFPLRNGVRNFTLPKVKADNKKAIPRLVD